MFPFYHHYFFHGNSVSNPLIYKTLYASNITKNHICIKKNKTRTSINNYLNIYNYSNKEIIFTLPKTKKPILNISSHKKNKHNSFPCIKLPKFQISKSFNMDQAKEKLIQQCDIKCYCINSYFCLSKAGGHYNKIKINQDAFFEKCNIKGLSAFGVFDGHGPEGTEVSQNVKDFIYNNLKYNENVEKLTKNKFAYLNSIFKFCEENLLSKKIDVSFSGTSANILLIISNTLICANIGDSRSILITTNNAIIPLSKDHKPDILIESERIKNMGGVIDRIKGMSYGPYRVWANNKQYPGLAMSRSIGDSFASSIGVINEAEFIKYNISDIKPKYIVCATDGLYEFLSNSAIKEIIEPYYLKHDARGATEQLYLKAKENWICKNNGIIDDITIIVIFF